MRHLPILPILTMIILIFGAHFYVFYRLWQMMPPTVAGRVLLVCSAVVALSSPFIGLLAGNVLPVFLTSLMSRIGTSWLIIFLYLLMVFLALDLVRVTHLLPVGRYLHASWAGLGILFTGITILMLSGYFRYLHKERVELSIPTGKEIAGGSDPLKIVAVSDLHLGYTIGKKELEGWVELINREQPDIVLIAGDITDNNVKPLHEQAMAEAFRRIHAKYGIITILGNHEYIAGAERAAAFFQSAGITLLRDSVALVDNRFYVIGRDDRSNPERKSIEELTAALDHAKPLILLDHQPYHLDETEKNRIDFQFSGHTHSGQVWPISLVTRLLFEQPHGYLKKGGSHIYVSSGLGIWGGKFRIGTRSEYVVVRLLPSP
jgi:predicted MPP superfamily phosphohydrolase